MRQINEARRHRVLSLSTRLEAISATRRELLRQLEDLDAEAISVSLERNILHNLDRPTSNIPNEVLAMIFEEGMRPQSHGHYFGTLVSHISHHWRDVALATPTLWNKLRFIAQSEDEVNPISSEQLMERARVFLSRARLCPVDIYIEGFDDCSMFIQLIGEHVGHCRQLRTREVGQDCLTKLLECFSSKPIPLLTSIDLSSDFLMELPSQIFPYGAPRLTTVQFDGTEILGKYLYIPAFSSVSCLRLTGVYIELDDSEEYSSFRDGLMALLSLHHLELQVAWLVTMPHYLPIVLPTLQFLQIDVADCPDCLGPLISVLQAASLVTLSLTGWGDDGVETDLGNELEFHLPSLTHLILADGNLWDDGDIDIFARLFPGIERLSVGIMAERDLRYMLDAWPKLQTIATSDVEEEFDVYYWPGVVSESQDAGHPIRRLMLPETVISEEDGAGDVVELRKLVAMEDYYVDWPTPFERE